MPISEGLKNSLNEFREISTDIYHRYIPIISDETDISVFASPILDVPEVQNEFISALINRIAYTQFLIKYFRNPLKILEGDRIPLGAIGQEIYVNPAKGRKFNINDFAGLLKKYEADVKVQYHNINMDVQYPVTIGRQELKKAFVSWGELESFIDGITNSLYNGAYIDEYRFTKNVVAEAYKGNKAMIKQVTAPSTKDLASEFVTNARELYLNMQSPSSDYNAWTKVGGEGKPIVTWSNPDEIVFIIKNSLRAFLDVNVLASAFNMDKTELLGKIITVDNFDVYDDDNNKIYDGSKIIGFVGDMSWFRIKQHDMFLDSFYNANNRTWQYYLNLVKMYNYSLFANGVILATELPNVSTTDIQLLNLTPINRNTITPLNITVTPPNASDELIVTGITFADTDVSDKIEITVTQNRILTILVDEDYANTSFDLKLKSGSVEKTFTISVGGTPPVVVQTATQKATINKTATK